MIISGSLRVPQQIPESVCAWVPWRREWNSKAVFGFGVCPRPRPTAEEAVLKNLLDRWFRFRIPYRTNESEAKAAESVSGPSLRL